MRGQRSRMSTTLCRRIPGFEEGFDKGGPGHDVCSYLKDLQAWAGDVLGGFDSSAWRCSFRVFG